VSAGRQECCRNAKHWQSKRTRSAYFRTILTDPAKRMGRLREGLISTSRVLLLRGPIARIAHWWRSEASADEMR
jgi:hypothetical protein